MTELEKLERRIRDLPKDQFVKLREWFVEYDHALWDRQIETDSKAGKLDSLASEAVADYKAGRAKKV
jgi:hypothetical protein